VPATWSVLWTRSVQDYSSSATGSSVFDFNSDGLAEVVYADETTLHVYNGADGAELLSLPHCSGTIYENPVIVDVDGDGHANIVVPVDCSERGAVAGITVYRDALDGWAPTRPIWNQHTYHVTNVCDGKDLVCGGQGAPENGYGRIPATEKPNWSFSNEVPGALSRPLNNYRQNNTTARTAMKAPDVRPRELSVDVSKCPETVLLKVLVGNRGEVATKPGMKVAFYEKGTHALLASAEAPAAIAPGRLLEVVATWQPPSGQQWPVEVVASVDDDGAGAETELECHEDNNLSAPVEVRCGG
jgi:hypothetical protein